MSILRCLPILLVVWLTSNARADGVPEDCTQLILGIPPMSQFDAAAHPMYNAFTTEANYAPYTTRPVAQDLEARNTPLAWGAQKSLRMQYHRQQRDTVAQSIRERDAQRFESAGHSKGNQRGASP